MHMDLLFEMKKDIVENKKSYFVWAKVIVFSVSHVILFAIGVLKVINTFNNWYLMAGK